MVLTMVKDNRFSFLSFFLLLFLFLSLLLSSLFTNVSTKNSPFTTRSINYWTIGMDERTIWLLDKFCSNRRKLESLFSRHFFMRESERERGRGTLGRQPSNLMRFAVMNRAVREAEERNRHLSKDHLLQLFQGDRRHHNHHHVLEQWPEVGNGRYLYTSQNNERRRSKIRTRRWGWRK